MPVFALLVISKAGSLIYHRTFPSIATANSGATATTPNHNNNNTSTGTLGLPGTSALTTNDYLVLAGTFHGVHAITKSLTPKIPLSNTHHPYQDQQSQSRPLSQQQQQQQPPPPPHHSHDPSAQIFNRHNTSTHPQQQQQPQPSWTYPDPTIPASGIESLETSFFRLTVNQTATGTKFLLFTDPSMSPSTTDTIMRGIYERYADHVCKNPFWQMEMPIRLEGWDREIGKWLAVRR